MEQSDTHLSSSQFYMGAICDVPNKYKSNIEDRCPQITRTNVTMVRMFAVLEDLPKHDRETQSEQMPLEKWYH